MSESKNFNLNKQDEFRKIRELFYICIANWKWFLLSIVITLSLGMVKINKTVPTFSRTTSILIRDDQSGNSFVNGMDMFSDKEFLKTKINIKNEIQIITSPVIIDEVVRRGGFNMNYFLINGSKNIDLYKINPVVVAFDSLIGDHQSVNFILKPLDKERVELYNFVLDGRKFQQKIVVQLGTPTNTPCGNILIYPTIYFGESFLNKEILFTKTNLKQLSGAFSSRLSVYIGDKDATILNLTLKDPSPSRAEDFLNMLTEVYREEWIFDKDQIIENTSVYLNERIKVFETDLLFSNQSFSEFISDSTMILTNSDKHNAQILRINNRLLLTRNLQDFLKKGSSTNQLLPSNTGIGNPSLEAQITEYNTLLLQKKKLLKNNSLESALIKDIDQSLVAKKQLLLNSFENYIETLKNKIKFIVQNEPKEGVTQTDSDPKLISIEHQQKVKKSIYLFLLQKREENEMSRTFTTHNVKIIKPASGSSAPITPNKQLFLICSLLIGIMIPGLIIFVLVHFSTKIRSKRDLSGLSIPLISELPFYALGKKRKTLQKWSKNELSPSENMIVVEDGNSNRVNEAFRVLRTQMEFIYPKQSDALVGMITSINSGAGKSYVTINLAKSLALKGFKVLVIDFDFRKTSLSNMVSSPKDGVSNFLKGEVSDPYSLIVKGNLHPNLDLLPVGEIPSNPSELLKIPALQSLIEPLKSEYKYILIDTPTIDSYTDADLIAKVVDFTLFVARMDLLDQRLIPDLELYFQNKRFPDIRLILNCTGQNLPYR